MTGGKQVLKLGEIMLNKRWISEEQLEHALSLAAQHNTRLGEMLLQLGWIGEKQLEQALKEQYWRQHGFWVIS